ncbi:MAG: hypothetical protein WCA20_04670 [Candidatus Sulfotelmatobacter sp.]
MLERGVERFVAELSRETGMLLKDKAAGSTNPSSVIHAEHRSKRRFSSVTQTAISSASELAERREPQAGSASATAPAANPAADVLRKSRLVLAVEISASEQLDCEQESHACQIMLIDIRSPDRIESAENIDRLAGENVTEGPPASPSRRFRLP